jgi:hypothetical protein
MNFQLRTNETLRIDQLMNRVFNSFHTANDNIQAISHDLKVEGGGPVRPAVRVPYSSSHYLSDEHYGGGDSDRTGSADPSTEVVAA